MSLSRTQALLDWYRAQARDLPWRRTRDPYPILVSEVMLQQTQVERVVPRYLSFLARFPDIDALATASLTDVLSEWSGLGYNSRAKRLRDAARQVRSSGWPVDAAGLAELPGVGTYTAAAVAAFAFGAGEVAVDTNVRRVVARWLGEVMEDPKLEAAVKDEVPPHLLPEWNQAVMDLGASVCRPRAPVCGQCPVSKWCLDPNVYQAPRRQSSYQGSVRQMRASILAALASVGPAGLTLEDLTDSVECGGDVRFGAALSALDEEGMIVIDGPAVAVAP